MDHGVEMKTERKPGGSLMRAGQNIRLWATVPLLLGLAGCGEQQEPASSAPAQSADSQPALTTRSVPIITVDGFNFRDLNRNSQLEPYEDWRLSPAERAADLVSRMTVVEKAGQMLHANSANNAPFGQPATGYDLDQARDLIVDRQVGALISRLNTSPSQLAAAHNALQEMAEERRLAIPLVTSTDPRSHFQETVGASASAGDFSQWPELLGLAAIGDAELVQRFADVARQEHRAVGFSMTLSPQADLATEPRWPRIYGTFGEDAELAATLVAAYVTGFQGSDAGPTHDGLAAVVKHWVGYGAARDGWDSHNYYGRYGQLQADQLDAHLRPFEAAFDQGVAAVMPAYSVFAGLEIDGRPVEPTGVAFSKVMLSYLLRERYQFDGMVLSDWAVTNPCGSICREGFPEGVRPTLEGISTAWGVEDLPSPQRMARAINAGVDQIGGSDDLDSLLAAIEQGLITEQRVDEAVQRILEISFALGLFETPFVDEQRAASIVGQEAFRTEAETAQARSIVVLEDGEQLLPLSAERHPRIWLHNVSTEAARAAGFEVVEQPGQADIALFGMAAPYEQLHPNFFFGSMQHEGSLAFPEDDADLALLQSVSAVVPTVVSVYLDRPAVLTPVQPHATVILANFGVSDQALFAALTGAVPPEGRLPFELPSSMEAVLKQRPDTPADSENPLYPLGYAWQAE